MGDYGFGGDLNGNGKFDPGDYEIWKDTMKGSSGGGGNSGGGSSAGIWIFFLVCAVIGGINGTAGALLLLLGLYAYWMIH